MLKAALLDFDGTLVTNDMLSVAAGIVGKENESRRINDEFWAGKRPGVSALVERINFLKGVTITQIEQCIAKDLFLMPGAKELLAFFRTHNIVTIIASGSITPITNYYAKLLQIDEVVGPTPTIIDGVIQGISEYNFSKGNFKIDGIQKILSVRNITAQETVAIGDSVGDIPLFSFSKHAIAIDPKKDVESHVDDIIHNTLADAIPIIEKFL